MVLLQKLCYLAGAKWNSSKSEDFVLLCRLLLSNIFFFSGNDYGDNFYSCGNQMENQIKWNLHGYFTVICISLIARVWIVILNATFRFTSNFYMLVSFWIFVNRTKQMLLYVSYEARQFPFLNTSRKVTKIFTFHLMKRLEYFRYQSRYTVVIAFALKLYFISRFERRKHSLNLETFTESLKLWKKEVNYKTKRSPSSCSAKLVDLLHLTFTLKAIL